MKTENINEEYQKRFGLPCDHQPKLLILTALRVNKRIKYLTQEEIDETADIEDMDRLSIVF